MRSREDWIMGWYCTAAARCHRMIRVAKRDGSTGASYHRDVAFQCERRAVSEGPNLKGSPRARRARLQLVSPRMSVQAWLRSSLKRMKLQ